MAGEVGVSDHEKLCKAKMDFGLHPKSKIYCNNFCSWET